MGRDVHRHPPRRLRCAVCGWFVPCRRGRFRGQPRGLPLCDEHREEAGRERRRVAAAARRARARG